MMNVWSIHLEYLIVYYKIIKEIYIFFVLNSDKLKKYITNYLDNIGQLVGLLLSVDFLLLMGYVVEVGQVGHDKQVVGGGQEVGGELQF